MAAFVAECRRVGTSEEALEKAEKKGMDTGVRVRHPFDESWELPVYIANFILMDYGTGAIFGCPAHDQRDFDFATRYRLPIKPVFSADGADETLAEAFVPMKSERVHYIRGFAGNTVQTGDEGVATAVGIQLRPVTIDPANYTVEAANVSPTVVTMAVTVNSANAYQWSGTMTVVSGTTTTLVVSGDQTANAGLRALVFVGTGNVRGGYQFVTLGAAVFGGVNTTFSQTGAQQLLGAPSGTVYPASLNYPSIRLAVLNLFDALTPGDTATPSRWPAENSIISPQIARLVPSRIVAAVQDVVGVISVTVSNPASILTPTTKSIITLSTLTVTP